MHARSARDPFSDRISESFRANYLKFGVVSGRIMDAEWEGREHIHSCMRRRACHWGLLARGLLAAISCGNFGIVSCRPQTLSRLSALPSPSFFSPRLVVRVTLMRCKIDALYPSRALKLQRNRGRCIKYVHPLKAHLDSSHGLVTPCVNLIPVPFFSKHTSRPHCF